MTSMNTFKMSAVAMSIGLILSGGAALAANHDVKMLNNGKEGVMVFEPGFVKAAKGDTVTFLPTDPAHEVASVSIPKGAKAFKGDGKKPVKVTLDKEGVYLYDCNVHLPMAMVGVIQVGNSIENLPEAQKAGKELAAKFVVSKDRLDKYLAQVK